MLGLSSIFQFNFSYMYFATRPRASLREAPFNKMPPLFGHCPNMPLGVVKTGEKENLQAHQKWACACKFCEPYFQEFCLKWWRKELFCIVGTSLMGCGRVEWYWHMGMSYLTSLNPQLFKNIAYVGSFEHFSVQLFFTCILQINQDQR